MSEEQKLEQLSSEELTARLIAIRQRQKKERAAAKRNRQTRRAERKYPTSSTWGRDRLNREAEVHLRIPARVVKVCQLSERVAGCHAQHARKIKVEWRFYKTGVNGFRATVQEVQS